MKTRYIHNPNIYRDHYRSQIGTGLPGFRGMHMHRGHGIGSILGKLARKAIPLLISGAKLAKPHLVKAAKGIAQDVTGQVVQRIQRKQTHKRKRKPAKRVSRVKKPKRTTSPDIFDDVTY